MRGEDMDEEPKYISLVDVRGLLEEEGKKRELNHIQDLALKHASHFGAGTKTKATKLIKELTKVERVTEPIAFKISEILPEDANEVRAVFAKERFTLTPEEIEAILKIIKENK
jgi:DNA-directed RNA polymerase subunit F